MAATPEHPAEESSPGDGTRRTALAAERTWLAWWRTGLGASAVAIGVGRILPGLAGGARWPLTLLGIGYGVLAVAILIIGALRQNRVAVALRAGDYTELSPTLVWSLTLGTIVLGLGTLVAVAVEL
jgi:putative membrane protein